MGFKEAGLPTTESGVSDTSHVYFSLCCVRRSRNGSAERSPLFSSQCLTPHSATWDCGYGLLIREPRQIVFQTYKTQCVCREVCWPLRTFESKTYSLVLLKTRGAKILYSNFLLMQLLHAARNFVSAMDRWKSFDVLTVCLYLHLTVIDFG